jgi:hypothetical protein
MSWTAKELEAYIKANGVIDPSDGDGERVEWDEFVGEAAEGDWKLDSGEELLPVTCRRENEYMVNIFKIGDQYFRIMGEYDSWNGTIWDYAEIQEVVPHEVTIVKYKIK